MPWWGYLSSLLAPVILIAGWTVAADLQPVPFNAVQRSISTLAAIGQPHRWLITTALIAVGVCHAVTGLALRPAAVAGRLGLLIGGISTIMIAVYPQNRVGQPGSLAHEAFSLIGIVAMTAWPVAGMRRDPGAPPFLRPRPAWIVTGVLLVILAWFVAELFNGPLLGLAERTVTEYESVWPMLVVLSVAAAQRRAAGYWLPGAVTKSISSSTRPRNAGSRSA